MPTNTSQNEQGRPSNKAIGAGLGNGTNAWSAGIWGNNPIGSGLKNGVQDAAQSQSMLEIIRIVA